MKSKDNVPQGKSSLQFEIYYIKQNSLKYSDEGVKSKVINSITEWGIFTKEDIQIVKV